MLLKRTAVFFILVLAFFSTEAQAPRACSALGPNTCHRFSPVPQRIRLCKPPCLSAPTEAWWCRVAKTSTASYEDKNPFWYRFTCYQAGTLGLLITPNDLKDDYDWQLYDITGITNLNAVYTDANLL